MNITTRSHDDGILTYVTSDDVFYNNNKFNTTINTCWPRLPITWYGNIVCNDMRRKSSFGVISTHDLSIPEKDPFWFFDQTIVQSDDSFLFFSFSIIYLEALGCAGVDIRGYTLLYCLWEHLNIWKHIHSKSNWTNKIEWISPDEYLLICIIKDGWNSKYNGH